MAAAPRRDGVDLRTGHRVQRLVVRDGAVVGVEATTTDGRTHRVAARKAVVFATGGFTHDVDLRRSFLTGTTPGCARCRWSGRWRGTRG
jgi:3-oxosteroid 1-dehydrogenase